MLRSSGWGAALISTYGRSTIRCALPWSSNLAGGVGHHRMECLVAVYRAATPKSGSSSQPVKRTVSVRRQPIPFASCSPGVLVFGCLSVGHFGLAPATVTQAGLEGIPLWWAISDFSHKASAGGAWRRNVSYGVGQANAPLALSRGLPRLCSTGRGPCLPPGSQHSLQVEYSARPMYTSPSNLHTRGWNCPRQAK